MVPTFRVLIAGAHASARASREGKPTETLLFKGDSVLQYWKSHSGTTVPLFFPLDCTTDNTDAGRMLRMAKSLHKPPINDGRTILMDSMYFGSSVSNVCICLNCLPLKNLICVQHFNNIVKEFCDIPRISIHFVSQDGL